MRARRAPDTCAPHQVASGVAERTVLELELVANLRRSRLFAGRPSVADDINAEVGTALFAAAGPDAAAHLARLEASGAHVENMADLATQVQVRRAFA